MNDFNNILHEETYYNQFQLPDLTQQINTTDSQSNIQNNFFFQSNGVHDEYPQQPVLAIPTVSSQQITSNTTNNVDFPFVRIHAFDSTLSIDADENYRTNNKTITASIPNSNNREIKPKIESIKSELNDIQQNLATSSPQSRKPQTPDTETSKTISPKASISQKEEIKIHKCKQCMYLTTCETNLENHVASSVHEHLNNNIQKSKLTCPGCDNIFHTEISLSSHLENDHLMTVEELRKFLEYRNSQTASRKSRIYLKNVECLREQPSQQQLNLSLPSLTTDTELLNSSNNFCEDDGCVFDNELTLIDLINVDSLPPYDENDELMVDKMQPLAPPSVSQQKITIKSVENLREPFFLQQQQQHHQQQQLQVPNNLSFSEPTYDQSGNKIFYNMDAGYNTNSFQSDENLRLFNRNDTDTKKIPRRAPKIYIKNVDILKEPILLPPSNSSNILNVNETLNFNILATRQIPLQTQSPVTVLNNNNNESNFDITGQPNKHHFTSESSEFNYNTGNCKQFQANEKSKIYIKNVDILKQPQFKENSTKKSTNFLHLRTVDELNLMNKNQLNLMNTLQHQNHHHNNIHNNYQEILNPSSENSKNSDEITMSNNYEFIPNFPPNNNEEYNTTEHDENELTQANWSNYHGFENLENITISNSSSLCGDQKNHHYDLNTPKRLPLTDDNMVAENDNEMLLVCAEELIGNQEKEICCNLISGDDSDPNNAPIHIVDSNVYNEDCNGSNIIDAGASESVDIDIEGETLEVSEDLKSQENYDCVVEIPDDPSCDDNSLNTINLEEDITVPEKGRIYVSDNLMKDRNTTLEINNIMPTSDNKINNKKKPKGRPVGSKSNRLTKCKLIGLNGLSPEKIVDFKCDFMDCAYRFKLLVTLEYHRKCHVGSTPHSMQCPDCQSQEFSSWNTLHTHLWRNHKIDMELYGCELCNFKTPILSRLINTHSKIHSDERNFKCDQCEKAFKNSKQLKNHRRLHRTWKKPIELFRCENCSSVFSTMKTKKEHFCQHQTITTSSLLSDTVLNAKCSVCDKLCSSKSALRLHLLIHQQNNRYKCENCEYVTNDHNAFRRHKSTHDKSKMYECLYCDYKCIQSVLYKKHVTAKHPEFAANIIHKCTTCSFSTINQTQFHVHVAKHNNQIDIINNELSIFNENNIDLNIDEDLGNKIPGNLQDENEPLQRKNKIKVKSDLVLTDPSKFLLQTSNDGVT